MRVDFGPPMQRDFKFIPSEIKHLSDLSTLIAEYIAACANDAGMMFLGWMYFAQHETGDVFLKARFLLPSDGWLILDPDQIAVD